MTTLTGTEKQVKWAEGIRAEYIKSQTFLNREVIDTEDSSFWIEFRNIATSNVKALQLGFYLEAVNFIKSGKNLDDIVDFSEISEDAYEVLCKNETDIVKFCK
mgnify:CR=1 FL=1